MTHCRFDLTYYLLIKLACALHGRCNRGGLRAK